MYTTMQQVKVVARGELLIPDRSSAGRSSPHVLAMLTEWANANPAIASLTLSVGYAVALAALVAVLATSALDTLLGIAAMVLYAGTVLVSLAVGIYAVIPEHRGASAN